jgi:hypothetical protein
MDRAIAARGYRPIRVNNAVPILKGRFTGKHEKKPVLRRVLIDPDYGNTDINYVEDKIVIYLK